jgi:hypothetical protein
MAKHTARLGITRQLRNEADEFHINLYKLIRCQAGNIEMVKLHFSYTISFESFLSSLKNETALQNDKGGFTLKDGPWKYSVILNGTAGGLWPNIKHEWSFNDMLARLKVSSGAAVIIHVSTLLFHLNLGLPFRMT